MIPCLRGMPADHTQAASGRKKGVSPSPFRSFGFPVPSFNRINDPHVSPPGPNSSPDQEAPRAFSDPVSFPVSFPFDTQPPFSLYCH